MPGAGDDFDLLRGTMPGCDSQSHTQSGISLASSCCAQPPHTFLGTQMDPNSGLQSSRPNSSDQSRVYETSRARHSIGAHASATCSAGMLPPIMADLQSNPFDTGLLHSTRGSPFQEGVSGVPDINEGNMNLLTCTGVPGMYGHPAVPGRSDLQAVRNNASASMPQVLCFHYNMFTRSP